MIINISNSNTYSLIFDSNDLNKYHINILSLCGNPSKFQGFLNKILENNSFSDKYTIHNIKFMTFQFKIFKITFSINNLK